MCVCVCVRARAPHCVFVCVWALGVGGGVCARARTLACVFVSACAGLARVCVRVCGVCVRERVRERERGGRGGGGGGNGDTSWLLLTCIVWLREALQGNGTIPPLIADGTTHWPPIAAYLRSVIPEQIGQYPPFVPGNYMQSMPKTKLKPTNHPTTDQPMNEAPIQPTNVPQKTAETEWRFSFIYFFFLFVSLF